MALDINTKIEGELLRKCIQLRQEFAKYPTVGQAMRAVEQLSQEEKLALLIGLSITSIEELTNK